MLKRGATELARDYVLVARVGDVPPGTVRTFVVNGRGVALANVSGTFFATQDLCTHDGGPLGDGEMFDYDVECPRHGGRFDVRTGEVAVLPPMRPIRTWPVRVHGDEVQVALPEESEAS